MVAEGTLGIGYAMGVSEDHGSRKQEGRADLTTENAEKDRIGKIINMRELQIWHNRLIVKANYNFFDGQPTITGYGLQIGRFFQNQTK